MATETERKYRVDDLDAIRARLCALGAKRLRRVEEQNTLFDTPDRALLARDSGLRLRAERDLDTGKVTATLTFKGPRELAGAFKTRDEWEITVSDGATASAILEQLALTQLMSYKKRREYWGLGRVAIGLDDLGRVGKFVEIEGAAAEIETAERQVGLVVAQVEPRTYPEIITDHERT
ncbi:MAG: class IV adenylate cyclase [Phycisphaerales bacterium]|nr:class IV adenylate cyclase [Phycisphaerales bacterium]